MRRRQTFLILCVCGSVGLFVAGLVWRNLSSHPSPGKLPPLTRQAGPERSKPLYGRPFTGVLMWENDRKFREFYAKTKLSIRMAAFQTTLPDPLPGEEYNVALAADRLAGTTLQPGAEFSMNRRVGPYDGRRGFREGPTYVGGKVAKTSGGGVCKIASTLYNVTTLANLQILERHPHGMQVPYVPPGQDATVSEGYQDFRFRNNSKTPIFIWADTRGNTLYMAIYGGS